MSLYELPEQVKNNIENESLSALREINEYIVVIGGWAARAHGGSKHTRYTFDIDGIADEQGLKQTEQLLEEKGFSVTEEDWGFRAAIPYETRGKMNIERNDLKIRWEPQHGGSYRDKRGEERTVLAPLVGKSVRDLGPEHWRLGSHEAHGWGNLHRKDGDRTNYG